MVWVVVLNWNQKDLTADCIESLQRTVHADTHIVILDNGSTDGSPVWLSRRFPEIEVVHLANNLGFTGGANAGIRRALAAGADLIWLVSNDVVVDTDCFGEMLAAFDRYPELDLASPYIYYFNEPQRLWFGGARLHWYRASGFRFYELGSVKPHPRPDRASSFVVGCAPMFRSRLVNQIGYFDEALNTYVEDVDWSIRAQRVNAKAMALGQARIWHKTPREYTQSAAQLYLMTRNRFLVQLKHHGRFTIPVLALTWLAGRSARHAFARLMGRDASWVKSVWHGMLDGVTRRPARYVSPSPLPGNRTS